MAKQRITVATEKLIAQVKEFEAWWLNEREHAENRNDWPLHLDSTDWLDQFQQFQSAPRG